MVERAYRDARINRLFEGTSEINRLVISGMPLKRAARGMLPLLEAARKALRETLDRRDSPASSHGNDEEMRLVRNAKTIALFSLGVADARYAGELEKQQEIVMSLSDILMETFAMESTLLRCRKVAAAGESGAASAICTVFLRDAMTRIQAAAQMILGGCSAGSELHRQMAALRSLAEHDPVNAIALRHSIAHELLDRERYPF
jgi:alkylation response protein AidB-like acyl-CoA dehydrogenase